MMPAKYLLGLALLFGAYGVGVWVLASMPMPEPDYEAIDRQCSTDAECRAFWANRAD